VTMLRFVPVIEGFPRSCSQMYAVLEERAGNLKKARDLFDAALVVNKGHAAAWHGWGLLEKRDGNLAKAKSLFLKGLKNCPTNA
jgi:tetratricopeptide (TPR) repeat protein